MDHIERIKKKAERAGYSIYGLFIAADVSYSNWSRWKNKSHSPLVTTVDRLMAVPAQRKSKRKRAA
jgi:hypothetical protein